MGLSEGILTEKKWLVNAFSDIVIGKIWIKNGYTMSLTEMRISFCREEHGISI